MAEPLLNREFFSYLRQKNEHGLSLIGFVLPDTLVIEDGIPLEWYFTSSQSGEILRKNKSSVTNEAFYRAVTRNKGKSLSDIVATFYAEDVDENDDPFISVRHFTKDDLYNAFFLETFKITGIMQKFVDPKGDRNFSVRVTYSPRMCVFERRVCLHSVTSRRVPPFLRAVTFEGDASMARNVPLAGEVLQNRFVRICQSICKHFEKLGVLSNVNYEDSGMPGEAVSLLEVFAKIDTSNRVVIQWCSRLRSAPTGTEMAYPPSIVDEPPPTQILYVPPEMHSTVRRYGSRPGAVDGTGVYQPRASSKMSFVSQTTRILTDGPGLTNEQSNQLALQRSYGGAGGGWDSRGGVYSAGAGRDGRSQTVYSGSSADHAAGPEPLYSTSMGNTLRSSSAAPFVDPFPVQRGGVPPPSPPPRPRTTLQQTTSVSGGAAADMSATATSNATAGGGAGVYARPGTRVPGDHDNFENEAQEASNAMMRSRSQLAVSAQSMEVMQQEEEAEEPGVHLGGDEGGVERERELLTQTAPAGVEGREGEVWLPGESGIYEPSPVAKARGSIGLGADGLGDENVLLSRAQTTMTQTLPRYMQPPGGSTRPSVRSAYGSRRRPMPTPTFLMNAIHAGPGGRVMPKPLTVPDPLPRKGGGGSTTTSIFRTESGHVARSRSRAGRPRGRDRETPTLDGMSAHHVQQTNIGNNPDRTFSGKTGSAELAAVTRPLSTPGEYSERRFIKQQCLRGALCPECLQPVGPGGSYEVTYKMLMHHHYAASRGLLPASGHALGVSRRGGVGSGAGAFDDGDEIGEWTSIDPMHVHATVDAATLGFDASKGQRQIVTPIGNDRGAPPSRDGGARHHREAPMPLDAGLVALDARAGDSDSGDHSGATGGAAEVGSGGPAMGEVAIAQRPVTAGDADVGVPAGQLDRGGTALSGGAGEGMGAGGFYGQQAPGTAPPLGMFETRPMTVGSRENPFPSAVEDDIPPALRVLHPSMNVTRFKLFLEKPHILYQTCRVCDACFREISSLVAERTASVEKDKAIDLLRKDLERYDLHQMAAATAAERMERERQIQDFIRRHEERQQARYEKQAAMGVRMQRQQEQQYAAGAAGRRRGDHLMMDSSDNLGAEDRAGQMRSRKDIRFGAETSGTESAGGLSSPDAMALPQDELELSLEEHQLIRRGGLPPRVPPSSGTQDALLQNMYRVSYAEELRSSGHSDADLAASQRVQRSRRLIDNFAMGGGVGSSANINGRRGEDRLGEMEADYHHDQDAPEEQSPDEQEDKEEEGPLPESADRSGAEKKSEKPVEEAAPAAAPEETKKEMKARLKEEARIAKEEQKKKSREEAERVKAEKQRAAAEAKRKREEEAKLKAQQAEEERQRKLKLEEEAARQRALIAEKQQEEEAAKAEGDFEARLRAAKKLATQGDNSKLRAMEREIEERDRKHKKEQLAVEGRSPKMPARLQRRAPEKTAANAPAPEVDLGILRPLSASNGSVPSEPRQQQPPPAPAQPYVASSGSLTGVSDLERNSSFTKQLTDKLRAMPASPQTKKRAGIALR